MHLRHFFGFAIILALLAGCSASPQAPMRYLYPLPPEQPRIEWLGTFHSQNDFPKSDAQIAMEKIVGTPPLESFVGPYGIVADGEGKVFVTDMYLKNIRVYDFNQNKVSWLIDGPLLTQPFYLSIDSRKRIYVADAGAKKIFVLDRNGKVQSTIGEGELRHPSYVKVDEPHQRLYVSDTGTSQIVVYSLDGKKLFTIGKLGFAEGQLWGAIGIAPGPDGNLYVADTLNARIQVFDRDGKYLRYFGKRQSGAGGLEQPRDLAFDSEGHLWVADARRPYIQVFQPDGTLLLELGTGQADGHKMGFSAPTGIYISPTDEIYITDVARRWFSRWQYLSKGYLARNPVTEADLARIREQMQRAATPGSAK